MRVRLNLWSLISGCALAVGCGTTITFTPTNPAPHPLAARPPQTVEVYSTSQPPRPYVEVGLLEAQQSSAYSTDAPPEVLQHLREEAARQGCDGVVLSGANDAVVGDSGRNGGYTRTLRGYRATCIVYQGRTTIATPPPVPTTVATPPAPGPTTVATPPSQ
jgi:hypothetical protein